MPKNVLLLGLSTFNEKNEAITSHYRYINGDTSIQLQGNQTYEPVAGMLTRLLSSVGQTLDMVVMLCTEDASKYAIEDFKHKLGEEIEYVTVPVKNIMENEDEVFDACTLAVDSIPAKASVYLDVTGGFRDSAMLLTSVMQMIKGRDLSLEGVFYVNFFFGSSPENPCQILDRTGAYSAFDLVSGLNELLKTGSVATLEEYFFSKNLHPLEQAILDCLAEVSREIRLCRIGQSMVALSNLKAALSDYEAAEIKKSRLFAHVVEKGRQKYALLMDKEDATFADFVEWSVKNRDYSQALSYYYEKIPSYFVETGLIYPGEEQRKALMEGEPGRPLIGNERSWQQRFLAPRNPKVDTDKCTEVRRYYDKSYGRSMDALMAGVMPEDIREFFWECLNLRNIIDNKSGDIRRARAFWERARLGELDESIRTIEQCDRSSPQYNLYTRKNSIHAYFGQETENWSSEDYTAEELADLLIDRVDGKSVFSHDIEMARTLVADYYYFTRQRHSVLHASGAGDTPIAIIRRLERSVELLKKING